MLFWSKLESTEYRKLSMSLIEHERLISNFKIQLEALDMQFKQLRGKFYAAKGMEEKEEPKDLYGGMLLRE